MSGGNQVGQVSGQATSDANMLTGQSIEAMANRYRQLGLGGTGAQPSGPTTGAVPGVPGSGTTPTTPGSFASSGGGGGGGAPGTPTAGGVNAGFGLTSSGTPANSASGTPLPFGTSGTSGTTGAGTSGVPSFTGGPTAFEMDIGAAPSWTGGIPQMFQGALGEAQFQDLSQTASAAAGSAQAKGQTLSGIGQLAGAI